MQGEKQYKTGLDVGSTTAKIVIIDESGQTVFSRYERHNAQVNDLLSAYFREARQELGDIETSIAVTGSVGMGTAEQLRTEFIQEVVAATRYAQQLYPSASALIDIGGEDAKVVLFQGNHIDLRMNGNCAGGTGAFIDQMAVLLGVDIEELSRLALQAEHIHPIAARCGVFSKTDIQNLVSRNVPLGDIAASIFHAVAVQTIVTLSRGWTFHPPILLCGGPLTFIPALRKAFADYLHLQESDFILPAGGNLLPALGCALCATEEKAVSLSTLENLISRSTDITTKNNLPPLFDSETDYDNWKKEKAQSIMKPLMQFVDVCIGNEEDAELCLGFKPDADVEGGKTDAEGYKGIFKAMAKEFGFKYVISTLRESFSASHNGWKAMIYNGEEFYESKRYDINPIVDRVGGGDSFSGGIIHGLLTKPNQGAALEFAVAASALKHTINGDFNLVSVEEVEALAGGDASGRVQR